MAAAAVASDTKTEPSTISFASSPSVSQSSAPSDLYDKSDSASSSQRKDADILMSPAYLKSEEYRLLFRLPSDEVLVQDFNCAFQESILLQGHMYLFIRHICFYSNIFGFETKKTIPLHEVTCVRKAKTAAIFPNAIEILSGGKKYFFASFLSRDEAYRLIVDGWSQRISDSKVLIDQQELKSEIRSQEDVVEEVQSHHEPTSDFSVVDRNEDANISGESKLLSNGEDDSSISTRLLEPRQTVEVVTEVDVSAKCEASEEPLKWNLEDADPPKVPEYFALVAESKFPIQAVDFFNHFYSDSGRSFTESYHRRSGDKDFRCTAWHDHKQSGYTREVSFQHPIKIYFGAKFGNCHEVQKCRLYRNSYLVIETSQEVSDVPYGDYFRVEGFWAVEDDPSGTNQGCTLRVYVNVVFMKKTIWKGKIEQSTLDECREALSVWLHSAHECLKQKKLEKLNETVSTPSLVQSNIQLEGNEDGKGPSERLHDTRSSSRIPFMVPDSQDVGSQLENPVHRDMTSTSIAPSSFGESLKRFRLYFRSHLHVPLVLVVASVLVLLLMQLSIIVLLTKPPQVHIVDPVNYMNGVTSSRRDKADAVAWLEKQVHHLKDEMTMVEARLDKMRHEHALLKLHLKALEQIKE